MYRRVLLPTCLVLAVGTLGACSGSSDSGDGTTTTRALGAPAAAEAIDPCELLSLADIEQVTGTVLPAGEEPTEQADGGWEICNWEDPAAAAAIQVQVHLGDGRADFERRRHELGSGSVGPTRDVELAGADAAYDSVDQGTVGALVGEHFLQVVVIGGDFDDQHHLALAEAAVKGIER